MIEFLTLSPEINERDFLLYLTLAHRFTQDCPRAYSESGGYSLLAAYLDKAKRPDQKNVGAFVGGAMACLVTVEKEPNGVYLMHVTSPRGSQLSAITTAAYQVGWQLFSQLNAERVYAMVIRFKGRRLNLGVARLCEECGLRRTGHEEADGYGNIWVEYAMTRQDWMENHSGQKED